MNKSPMEVKMEELADIADQLDYSSCSDSSVVRGFYRGFKAALDLPEVKELVEILEQSLEVRDFEAPEDAEVKALGERIGFGALLDSAVKGWHQSAKEKGYPPGGAFTVGHCHATVESALKAWREFRGKE